MHRRGTARAAEAAGPGDVEVLSRRIQKKKKGKRKRRKNDIDKNL